MKEREQRSALERIADTTRPLSSGLGARVGLALQFLSLRSKPLKTQFILKFREGLDAAGTARERSRPWNCMPHEDMNGFREMNFKNLCRPGRGSVSRFTVTHPFASGRCAPACYGGGLTC